MAIPTYVASGALAAIATSTTLDTAFPAGVANGDIALLIVRVTGAITISSYPSGFTQVFFDGPNTGYIGMAALAWKRCDGTESSTTVTTTVSSASSIRGTIHVFRGCVASGTPYEAASGASYTSGTTTQSYMQWPAFTTTVADTLGVHIGYRGRNATLTPAMNASSGWTLQYDQYSTVSSSTFTYETVLETKSLAAAGVVSGVSALDVTPVQMGYFTGVLALLPATASTNSLFFGSMF